MNYDEAVREWGARKLSEDGSCHDFTAGRSRYQPPLDTIDRDTVTVEYYDDGGCETCGPDLGVRIEALAGGLTYAVHSDLPFVQVVREIAAVAQEAGQ